MSPLRSVLWIGRPERLRESPLSGAPSVDLTWTRDVQEALALALDGFDAVVLDAPDGVGAEQADRLRRAGARDVLVTHDPAHRPGLEHLAPLRPLSRRLGSAAIPAGAAPGAKESRAAGLVARSATMRACLALVDRGRRSRATVLLTGETGTGKEVLARLLHEGSARRARAFVAVNCAAFPDTLLESELFGHAKGAFTGAERASEGLFAAAHGGTLFLDEIGETSGPLQAKLLRVLQEGEVRPVGGTRARRVDVRVVAATNRDLRREIAYGHFREDLFYRLAVFPISVPPLRERAEDVLPLAEHFLRLHGRREGKSGCRLSKEAEQTLLSHGWPGNVRELENEMQRALALSEPGDEIPAARLSSRLGRGIPATRELMRDGESLRDTLARVERWLLRHALAQHGGRRTETARRLGLTREGLYKKMKRLGIE